MCSTCRDTVRSTIITKCMHSMFIAFQCGTFPDSILAFCKPCVDARLATRQRKCPYCNLAFGQSDVHTFFFQGWSHYHSCILFAPWMPYYLIIRTGSLSPIHPFIYLYLSHKSEFQYYYHQYRVRCNKWKILGGFECWGDNVREATLTLDPCILRHPIMSRSI